MSETYLSVNKFAQRWNLTSGTVHRWVREGKIPSTRRGLDLLIPVEPAEVLIRTYCKIYWPNEQHGIPPLVLQREAERDEAYAFLDASPPSETVQAAAKRWSDLQQQRDARSQTQHIEEQSRWRELVRDRIVTVLGNFTDRDGIAFVRIRYQDNGREYARPTSGFITHFKKILAVPGRGKGYV